MICDLELLEKITVNFKKEDVLLDTMKSINECPRTPKVKDKLLNHICAKAGS